VTQWMRQAVDDASRQLPLPEDWTQKQKEQYLDELTNGLDRMAAELADTLAATAITEWSTRHGQHPDYLTMVRLRQTALQNARETIVRQELYDLILQDEGGDGGLRSAADPTGALESSPVASALEGPPVSQRPERADRSPDREGVASADVFGDVPHQGGLPADRPRRGPVTDTRRPPGPLAAGLAPMVYEDLRADGYPET
jgi:hypothetical protein